MPVVRYGTATIPFTHKVNNTLKHGYITVEKDEGVILKAPEMEEGKAQKLVYKKAPWILGKMKIVKQEKEEEITTGSRLPYLGKSYYTQVILDASVRKAKVIFNYSRFKIFLNPKADRHKAIQEGLEVFYKEKARQKLIPRIENWITITGLTPERLMLRKLKKRWGSCTKRDAVIFNYNLVKLSASIQDYVIVHELCHIRIKRHSPSFWAEVGKFLPEYKRMELRLDQKPELSF